MLAAALCGTSIQTALLEAQEEPFVLEQLSKKVVAALVVPRPPMYVFANALIVMDSAGVIVVDTHASPSAAQSLIAQIRETTDRPVQFVINTHWHGDHIYGNQAYREAFPEVQFVGHRATREGVLSSAAEYLEDELAELPASIDERRKWLETGRGPRGEPLSAADSAAVERSLRLRMGQLEELQSLELIPPELTFTDTLSLARPWGVVRVIHFGEAHTDGDAVVYLPEQRILAVGDLVEEGLPYLDDANLPGWAAVLDSLSRLEFEIVLPSHGGILRDHTLLDVQREFFRELVSRVEASVAEEGSLERAQEDITMDRFRSTLAGHEVGEERYRSYVRNAVAITYRQIRTQAGSSPVPD